MAITLTASPIATTVVAITLALKQACALIYLIIFILLLMVLGGGISVGHVKEPARVTKINTNFKEFNYFGTSCFGNTRQPPNKKYQPRSGRSKGNNPLEVSDFVSWVELSFLDHASSICTHSLLDLGKFSDVK